MIVQIEMIGHLYQQQTIIGQYFNVLQVARVCPIGSIWLMWSQPQVLFVEEDEAIVVG